MASPGARILVTGGGGQIGRALPQALAPLGTVVVLDRRGLDLADPDAIRRAVREHRPSVIINAGAYTAVDRAESEPDIAMAVNATAPGILAEEAARTGAVIVHYSTDYVFDGSKPGPYVETDPPNPANAYGRSKLAGEDAVRAGTASHYILRTSWVYAAEGANFLNTMLRLAGQRPELRIVDDQHGAPTWAKSIADLTAQLLAVASRRDAPAHGLYHLTAAGETSWFGFAQAIFAEAGALLGVKSPNLVPITTAEYPLPARRPANSRLDNSLLQRTFGLAAPPWRDMLRDCLREKARAAGTPAP